jgi:DNA repair exonuclease SbcCD ATPase subunit
MGVGMKLNKIIINNFMSIGYAEVNLNGGMTLILGENQDSPVSESNGSGKSSLLQSVMFCLTGKTKSGVGADDVVNRANKNNCSVELVFDNYRIVRYRKHKTYKNELHIKKIEGGSEYDLTKGTTRETEQLLQDILGMSELTISKTTFFGQGDILPFASMTDADLKQVFEQGFGLVFFNDYQTKVKNHRAELEVTMSKLSMETSTLTSLVEQIQSLIDTYTTAITEYENQRFEQKKQVLKSIEDYKKQIESINNDTVYDKEAYNKHLEEYQGVKDKIVATEERIAKGRTFIDTIQNELSDKNAEYAYWRRQYENLDNRIKSAEQKIDTKCTNCGKMIVRGDMEGYIKTNKEQLEQTDPKYRDTRAEWKRTKTKSEQANKLYKQLEQELAKLKAMEKKYVEMDKKYEGLKAMYNQTDLINRQIDKMEVLIEEIEKRENPYFKKVESERIRKRESIDKQKEVECKKRAIADEIELSDMLVDIFGNQGLKSYLFDGLTPDLNRIANEYLTILDDIEVEFTTQKKLRSGDLREKFDIVVDNKHGGASYKALSGGEKRKVDIAVSLAFNRLVRNMTSNALNFIFLDEVFESLDSASSEKVLDLLMAFADSVDNIFVVSHNDSIKDLFANVITVVKENGVATIKEV